MRKGWAVVGIAAVGLGAAGVALARKKAARRQQLGRGAIRELHDLCTTVGGCRIYSRVAAAPVTPRAAPVVLLHGLGVSSAYFVPLAERLAPDFAVYAPDLPGHGKSDTPRQPLDVPALADALLAWMDGVGLERVSLVGHSMGCQIGVDAAVRYSQRFETLILMGPTMDPAARTTIQVIARFFGSSLYERFSLGFLVLADYLRMGRRFPSEFRFMLQDPIEQKLPHVPVPVMLVRGQNDQIVPQYWLDEAARLVGTDQIVVIPRWSHAVQYS